MALGSNAIVDGTPELVSVIAAADTLVGSTILRVVGNVRWTGVTVDTPTQYWLALLVGPASLDAVDTDPETINLDWLYWRADGARQPAYDGVDSFVNQEYFFDLKGKRRIDEGESLLLTETCAGANVNSFVNLRVLVLNP